jgi:hypothetical protein
MGLRSLRSFLPVPRRRSLVSAAASPGVPSPMAPSVQEVHLPRVCLARFVPPSGFLNLLAASSSPHLVALFHATSAWGFSLQSFPLPRSGSVSRRPMPSCRSPGDASLPKEDDLRRRSPSGLFSPCESVAPGSPLSSPVARCSPGILPSLGFSLSLPWSLLPASSPPVLVLGTAEALPRPGLQGFPLRGAWACLRRDCRPF